MKKRKILILTLSSLMIIAASVAVYLIIQREKNTTTDPLTSVEETGKPSAVNESVSTPVNAVPIPTIMKIEPSQPLKWGNSPSNLSNGGLFASQGGYLYFNYAFALSGNYNSNASGLWRAKKDGITGLTSLSSRGIFSINTVGEWIYSLQDGGIWRVKINGEGMELVMGGNIDKLFIYNGTAYYNMAQEIHCSNINNFENSTLLVKEADFFTLTEDCSKIIYWKSSPDGAEFNLYSADIDGKNTKQLLKLNNHAFIGNIATYDNYVYFSSPFNIFNPNELSSGSSSVYRINIAAKDLKAEKYIVTDKSIQSLNIEDKYLYYITNDYINNCVIFSKKDLTTDSEVSFTSKTPALYPTIIYVFDGKMYFSSLTANNTLSFFHVNFDKKTIVENKVSY